MYCAAILNEVFCAAILQYANTKKHKGDFFTKDSLSAEEFNAALKSLRIHGSFEDFLRGERKNLGIKPQITPEMAAKELAHGPVPKMPEGEGG